MAGEDVLLGGFWFLKSLFWGSIIFFFVRRYIVNIEWGGNINGRYSFVFLHRYSCSFTGGYTFNVLTWHFLSFKVISILLIIIYVLSIDYLECFPTITEYALDGWWLLYTVAGVGIPIVWTYYYHRLKSVCFPKVEKEKSKRK